MPGILCFTRRPVEGRLQALEPCRGWVTLRRIRSSSCVSAPDEASPASRTPGREQAPVSAASFHDQAVWWHYNTRFDTVGRAAIDALTRPDWIGHAVFITG